MAEFGYNDLQTIQAQAGAILRNIRPCQRRPQLVMHEDESSQISLRGAVANPCATADYEVKWSCNIAVPEGGTPGEIQIALALNGDVLPLTIAAATPAAAEEFWNVSGVKTIRVQACCCPTIEIVNASVLPTPATVPAPAIVMRNLNVTVNRVA